MTAEEKVYESNVMDRGDGYTTTDENNYYYGNNNNNNNDYLFDDNNQNYNNNGYSIGQEQEQQQQQQQLYYGDNDDYDNEQQYSQTTTTTSQQQQQQQEWSQQTQQTQTQSSSQEYVINEGLTYHMNDININHNNTMSIRQTRRGWCQELIGIEAKTEFKYYKGNYLQQEQQQQEQEDEFNRTTTNKENYFATTLEDSDCFCRVCCTTIHPFTMSIIETNNNNNNDGAIVQEEILFVERPCACAAGPCKCCCYQEAYVYTKPTTKPPVDNINNNNNGSNNDRVLLGTIIETCWFCVPSFVVEKHNNNTGEYNTSYNKPNRIDNIEKKYIIHPKTCCCFGCCRYCCAEGNPCTSDGCCKIGFYVFPYEQKVNGKTNGKNAPYDGSIIKKPKSISTEVLTDAIALDINFPTNSSTNDKALIVGSALFFNSMFFEGGE